MKQPDADALAAQLAGRFGIGLSARIDRADDGEYLSFSPAGWDEREAFAIRVRLGWRSVDAEFVPGSYSADLLLEMGHAGPEKRSVFQALARKVIEDGGRVDMKVNGGRASPTEPDHWPQAWQHLTISLQRAPLLVEPTDGPQRRELVITWGGRLLGMVLALLPLEEAGPSTSEPIGLPEGAKTRVEVNRYERNPVNRAACIQVWGTACRVCGIEFGRVYGPTGEGFIHVHHLTPVSALVEGYLIDPVKDLAPVCPNCHAMLHRSDPPYSLEQLRSLIQSARAREGGGSSGA